MTLLPLRESLRKMLTEDEVKLAYEGMKAELDRAELE